MGFLFGSDISVPDTSVPKPKNSDTNLKSDWFNWIATFTVSGRLENTAVTPDEQERLKAWRPPHQDEIDMSTDDSWKKMQDIVLRESWVKAMMLRLVRDQLNACYKDNGVNHYENCAHLSEMYLKWMREGYRVRGGKIRMKVDQRVQARPRWAARPPADAPQNRIWQAIDDTEKENPYGDRPDQP